ncbi:MAG: DNA-binding protein [Polaromonas sp.]|uniref:DNA-binding protein n=1 Tax=unclassified Polaromonas TaxID=2638319 RepID=UPI002488A90A|nr:DNA-binding protein [Polaromonas sp.]MDI1237252.1 DNA-binding protein [Polaromonas sp.]MDO8387305.1 DNA-binding protein [Polaromonas sp.]MDO8776809.1 DNA-binding protein [Burkholderiaceae bacterium]
MDTKTNPKGDHPLSTEEFANLNFVEPQTVIKRRCQTGTYHGVAARKLANGRLAWPNCQVLANREG